MHVLVAIHHFNFYIPNMKTKVSIICFMGEYTRNVRNTLNSTDHAPPHEKTDGYPESGETCSASHFT